MFLFIKICFFCALFVKPVSLSFLTSSVWELKLGKLLMGNQKQLSVTLVSLKAKGQSHLVLSIYTSRAFAGLQVLQFGSLYLLRTYLVSLSLVTVSRRVTVLFEGLPPFLRGSFGKITPTNIWVFCVAPALEKKCRSTQSLHFLNFTLLKRCFFKNQNQYMQKSNSRNVCLFFFFFKEIAARAWKLCTVKVLHE